MFLLLRSSLLPLHRRDFFWHLSSFVEKFLAEHILQFFVSSLTIEHFATLAVDSIIVWLTDKSRTSTTILQQKKKNTMTTDFCHRFLATILSLFVTKTLFAFDRRRNNITLSFHQTKFHHSSQSHHFLEATAQARCSIHQPKNNKKNWRELKMKNKGVTKCNVKRIYIEVMKKGEQKYTKTKYEWQKICITERNDPVFAAD